MEQRPIKIFPRRKQGQSSRGPDVYLNYDRLASFFHIRIDDAAKELVRFDYSHGRRSTAPLTVMFFQEISLTAMKTACRRLGIER